MNQDSSFPPMLPPSTELGAILFAVLPCLQETYRPLASFAYHMTELTRMKTIPSVPPLTGLSGIDALITDKDIMLRSLSFYGRMFRMPLLSTIATLLQGMQFYQNYKDILPGLFSGFGGFESGSNAGNASPDLFSMLGGLSPDIISSLFSGFSGGTPSSGAAPVSPTAETSEPNTPAPDLSDDMPSEFTPSENSQPMPDIIPDSSVLPDDEVSVTDSAEVPDTGTPSASAPPSDDLYNTLYSFLTPEQQKIYEQLMHTD